MTCTFADDLHWTVTVTLAALVIAAIWLGYMVGWVAGYYDHWRAARAGESRGDAAD